MIKIVNKKEYNKLVQENERRRIEILDLEEDMMILKNRIYKKDNEINELNNKLHKAYARIGGLSKGKK